MRDLINSDINSASRLTLDLALTVRHDGDGRIADDLTDTAGLTTWMRAHRDALPDADGSGFVADEAALTAVRELRAAVLALFARAVRPGEPTPADALRRLNAAAARTPTVPVLDWADGAEPVVHHRGVLGEGEVVAVLARAAVAFLAGADRERLRACHGPRCVRYFLKEHPRQEWCTPACGNRARVARHHERRKQASRQLTARGDTPPG